MIVKGIAILMMWHHCFLRGRFETYTFFPAYFFTDS